MSSARQIQFLVVLLIFLGVGAVTYKHLVLGFPLISDEQETLWNLETKITFEATASNVRLMLNLPDEKLN